MVLCSDHRWAITAVALVVLVAAAAAGFVLRELQRGPSADAGDPPASTTSAVPASEQPGSALVRLVADVEAHPDADQVRTLLQDYFDAINAGDYMLWSSTVTASRVQNIGRSAWREQYRSTLDGSIVVHRLEPRPGGGLIALLSFTSVQDPVDAPPDLPVRCLRWQVSYSLIDEGDDLRLAATSPNASLRAPC